MQEGAGCKGDKAIEDLVWTLQSFITFSTFLLLVAVICRTIVSHREKEKSVIYVGYHSDPPDLAIISHRVSGKEPCAS
jgi:hypothetical protein